MAHVNAFASTEADAEAEPALEASEDATVESTELPETDPTIAHAGLTEIDSTGATAPMTNGHGHTESTPHSGLTTSGDISDNAANAAGESQWDTPTNDLSGSITQEDWVKVPRDPAETDTGLTATPAAAGPVQSWADDQPENLPEVR